MANYKKMYLHLFNAVTDVISDLDNTSSNTSDSLKRAQQECEEMFMEDDEPILDFPEK